MLRTTALLIMLASAVTPMRADETLEVMIPAGTVVYGELAEPVTTRGGDVEAGSEVEARAWRNVVVDGQVVIAAGDPLRLRVATVKGPRLARTRGRLDLEAVAVRAVDGSEVGLDGGYDRDVSRKALSVAGTVYVWPLLLTKGKQVDLAPGTLFDATVQDDTPVEVPAAESAAVDTALTPPALAVEVMYGSSGKERGLPLEVRRCGAPLTGAAVAGVNGEVVEAIPLTLGPRSTAEGCTQARGTVEIKSLRRHFRPGINYFEIAAGEERAEVVLLIEY